VPLIPLSLLPLPLTSPLFIIAAFLMMIPVIAIWRSLNQRNSYSKLQGDDQCVNKYLSHNHPTIPPFLPYCENSLSHGLCGRSGLPLLLSIRNVTTL